MKQQSTAPSTFASVKLYDKTARRQKEITDYDYGKSLFEPQQTCKNSRTTELDISSIVLFVNGNSDHRLHLAFGKLIVA